MRLHRFFVEERLGGESIRISDEKLLHQMRDVFRLKTDDEVIFFDQPTGEVGGAGIDYRYVITMISKKEGVFEKRGVEKNYIPEKKVTLLMSVIKKENFELVVEKATELGVTEIVPIVTERTLVKNLNIERLRKIMIEASEQCGRGDIPTLGESLDLKAALENYPDIIAFDITGGKFENINQKSETSSLRTFSSSALLIGPEGGWSEKELALLTEKSITLAKLGDTTLRAETAAIVACAKVLSL